MMIPAQRRVEPISEISVASSETLQCMSCYRYPVYFTAATSAGIFGLRRLICIRRADLNNWELILVCEYPVAFEG